MSFLEGFLSLITRTHTARTRKLGQYSKKQADDIVVHVQSDQVNMVVDNSIVM